MACLSNSFCTAVVGTSALDWDGTTWSEEPTPWTADAAGRPDRRRLPDHPPLRHRRRPGLWVRNGATGLVTGRDHRPGRRARRHLLPDRLVLPGRRHGREGAHLERLDVVGAPTGRPTGRPVRRSPAPRSPARAASFCMVMNGDGDYATYSGPAPGATPARRPDATRPRVIPRARPSRPGS